MLKINKTLRHLNLDNNKIGVEGVTALADALTQNATSEESLNKNSTLETLSLCNS